MLDKSTGALRGTLLIIVSAKEGATIGRIKFVENIVDADKVIRDFLLVAAMIFNRGVKIGVLYYLQVKTVRI